MNGVGKSTILQAIDFLAQLMKGDIDKWLETRQWDIQDLNCKLKKENNITVNVSFASSTGHLVEWYASFNRSTKRCTKELFHAKKTLIAVKEGEYVLFNTEKHHINFEYQGSILSRMRNDLLPDELVEFKNYVRNIRSLELLSPHLIRQRSRNADKDIGNGGEKLSAYLNSLKEEQRLDLLNLLKSFYPNITDFKISNLRSGWKKLIVIERYNDQTIETEARHINDGLLRIMAILAQTNTENSLLLLDEVENGVNPEIIEKLVDILVNASRQILVTTHSPMILNYLDDDIAQRSVQFVYKNMIGATQVRPFFALARTKKKLQIMGAGEAFIDTDLQSLTQDCIVLDNLASKL